MGDRHSDGGGVDHRRAGTGGHGSGADDGSRAVALESALRRALRAGALDTSAEQRAVAAFRAARAEGVHQQARARRRDDWRSWHVLGRRSVRAAVAVLLAGLTFSGVAIAAIGSPESDGKAEDDGRVRRHPSSTAPQATAPASTPASASTAPSGPGSPTPAPSAGSGSPAPAPSVTRDRPPTAKDILAHCRAYASVKGRGKALESTAWKRFVEAAGGEDNVDAYCADQLSQAGTGNAGNAGNAGKGNGSDGGSGPAKDNGQPNGHSAGEKNEQSKKNAKNEKPGQAGAAKTE
ncbi:hypothetical protein [Streptomyces sp. CB01373]|uniref:hypothetical protein n=1 Tax=Streptomyces sp. CB01373 TaxID=2020325 RepID=UPI00131C50A1|nr:hypothetical protein [Streptomyces sp. CB01373]